MERSFPSTSPSRFRSPSADAERVDAEIADIARIAAQIFLMY